ALCSRLHDGIADRKRVQRGDERPASLGAHGSGCHSLCHHVGRQRSGSLAGLERVEGTGEMRTARSRHVISGAMIGLTYLSAALATLPLVLILTHLIAKGASSLSLAFFTHMPKPVGEPGGGMANAIIGTLILIGVASLIGLPVGIGAGLYLAEKRGTKLTNIVRFLADVLNGLPSIVMGIFAWQLLVRPVRHFSALAGAIALAAM